MYSAAWSANADFVVFGLGKQLVVKPILPSGKQEQWKAHEGTILQVDWNAVNGLIVSGGEDRKYKVLRCSAGLRVYCSCAGVGQLRPDHLCKCCT